MTVKTYDAAKTRLFKPVQVGKMALQHRIFMAPLTRYRNDDDHVALPLMARYYSDRGCVPGTLIISEATAVSGLEAGDRNLPSFAGAREAAAWKTVIDGVHARGSFFVQQLWGMGRAANPAYLAERGVAYRSSSAVAMPGVEATPAAMTEAEIRDFIDSFVAAARRAVAAGADAVEVHGAHGYLIDQFLSENVNQRTDGWGGSIEKRARLLLEVMRAVVAAVGAERVGVRLSPFAGYQGAQKSDIEGLYGYVLQQLRALDSPLAYLSLVEPLGDPNLTALGGEALHVGRTLDFLLEAWDNRSPVLVAGGYTAESAARAVEEQYRRWDVLIGFGRHYISTPDLVFRVQHGIPFNPYNRKTFYLHKASEGYNDYPFSEAYLEANPLDG